jgi:hypothetical protein
MTATDVPPRSTSGFASFTLERLGWNAPDRLELSGWFSGLDAAPPGAPALIARCGDESHRLDAVPGSFSWPPEDGLRWCAVFAWKEAPVPFDAAALELGGETMVDLPGSSELQMDLGEQPPAAREALSPDASVAAWTAENPSADEHRVAELLARELHDARAEIASLRSRLAAREYTRAQLEDAHRPVLEARAEAERLLDHLEAVELALKGAEY